jgi:hypothetical protein
VRSEHGNGERGKQASSLGRPGEPRQREDREHGERTQEDVQREDAVRAVGQEVEQEPKRAETAQAVLEPVVVGPGAHHDLQVPVAVVVIVEESDRRQRDAQEEGQEKDPAQVESEPPVAKQHWNLGERQQDHRSETHAAQHRDQTVGGRIALAHGTFERSPRCSLASPLLLRQYPSATLMRCG